MFEYWFIGLPDGGETGTTHDFLEVLSRIAQNFSPGIAGEFVNELLETKSKELMFLRVTEWKFEQELSTSDSDQKIILHKHI